MTTLDLLIEAIKTRKPVSFEYNKPNKTPGLRIGNTHAVFIFTSKAGQTSTKVHIVQTDGVSDTVHEKPFPDFRLFNIEDLSNVAILEAHPCFEPYHEKYNSDWDGYKDVIEKI
jgi:hypothetical protein